MSEWQSIDSIPDEMKDGRIVHVKRVYEGRIVKEGEAVFDLLHANAPSRHGAGIDPLGRLTAADYAQEAAASQAWAASKKWLLPDRMFAFPTPTHYLPAASQDGEE